MLPQILLDCSRHDLALRFARSDGQRLESNQRFGSQCDSLFSRFRFGCHPFLLSYGIPSFCIYGNEYGRNCVFCQVFD